MEKKIKELEKENKRISKQRDNLSGVCDRVIEENNYLEQENKKLSEKIGQLEQENKRLKEAFEIADMCVNNTTKKNKQLEVVINDLKTVIQELAKKHYGKPFKSINIEDRTYTLD